MIVALVDHHIVLGRHVALHTGRAGRSRPMEVMGRRIILRRLMATDAEIIPFRQGSHRVGMMAVRASHVVVVHLTLNERTILIVFFIDLPVSMIVPPIEQTWKIAIEITLPKKSLHSQRLPMGMARRAGIQLNLRCEGGGSLWLSTRWIEPPSARHRLF